MMRVFSALIIAALINAALFSLMQTMVSTKRAVSGSRPEAQVIDFVRLEAMPKSEPDRRRLQPPPKPAPQKVAQISKAITAPSNINPLPLPVAAIELDLPLEIGAGPYLGDILTAFPDQAPDLVLASELTPVVQIPPQYPLQAKRRHLQGYVDVEFTVDREGRVEDAKIVAAEPPNVFNRAVLQALRHWRFEPRLVDGMAVAIRAKQRIDFNLSGS